MPEETASYWTAVANIVRERPYGPGGAEIRLGTKHFAPGAKVYIIDWFPGTCERIAVVGLHRKAKQLIAIVIDVKLVENLRAKVCYAPAVIAKIKDYYQAEDLSFLTQEFADTLCQTLPFWQAQEWRHAQPKPAPPVPATLQLLREAAGRSPILVASKPAAPPPASSLLTRLWRTVRLWLQH
jgi:hypothetical protein